MSDFLLNEKVVIPGPVPYSNRLLSGFISGICSTLNATFYFVEIDDESVPELKNKSFYLQSAFIMKSSTSISTQAGKGCNIIQNYSEKRSADPPPKKARIVEKTATKNQPTKKPSAAVIDTPPPKKQQPKPQASSAPSGKFSSFPAQRSLFSSESPEPRPRKSQSPAPPRKVQAEESEDEETFEIEKVLNHRVTKKGLQFLIKWKGYTEEHNSWEPESSVADSAWSVRDYYHSKPTARYFTPKVKHHWRFRHRMAIEEHNAEVLKDGGEDWWDYSPSGSEDESQRIVKPSTAATVALNLFTDHRDNESLSPHQFDDYSDKKSPSPHQSADKGPPSPKPSPHLPTDHRDKESMSPHQSEDYSDKKSPSPPSSKGSLSPKPSPHQSADKGPPSPKPSSHQSTDHSDSASPIPSPHRSPAPATTGDNPEEGKTSLPPPAKSWVKLERVFRKGLEDIYGADKTDSALQLLGEALESLAPDSDRAGGYMTLLESVSLKIVSRLNNVSAEERISLQTGSISIVQYLQDLWLVDITSAPDSGTVPTPTGWARPDLSEHILTDFNQLRADVINDSLENLMEWNSNQYFLPACTMTTDAMKSALDANRLLRRDVQVFFIGKQHFVVVTYKNKTAYIHDSLLELRSTATKEDYYKPVFQFSSVLGLSKVIVRLDTQQQTRGSNLCGYFALAFVVDFVNSVDPGSKTYIESKMRQHLFDCITKEDKMLPFPSIPSGRGVHNQPAQRPTPVTPLVPSQPPPVVSASRLFSDPANRAGFPTEPVSAFRK